MLAHWGTVERSNADSHCCINSVLQNVLTKDQGGATLLMEGINLEQLKKNRKFNRQGVNVVV